MALRCRGCVWSKKGPLIVEKSHQSSESSLSILRNGEHSIIFFTPPTMPRHCVVPGCRATYESELKKKAASGGGKATSTFTPKTPEQIQAWQRAIPRKDVVITKSSAVCAVHFHSDDIITHKAPVKLMNGEEYREKLLHPRLKDSSVVPKIFPNLPPYLSTPQPTRRRAAPIRRLPTKSEISKPKSVSTEPENVAESLTTEATSTSAVAESVSSVPSSVRESSTTQDSNVDIASSLSVVTESADANTPPSTPHENMSVPSFQVTDIRSNLQHVKLPSTLWASHSDDDGKFTAFTHINTDLQIDKAIVFRESIQYEVLIFTKKLINMNMQVTSLADVERLVQKVHRSKYCIGWTEEGVRNPQFTENCSGFLSENSLTLKMRCVHCKARRKRALESEKGKENVSKDKVTIKKKKQTQQTLRRLKSSVQKLRGEIERQKEKMKSMSDVQVEKFLTEVPPEQRELLKAIFNSAKAPKHGRRYTTEWIYECLLMKIKASGLYRKLQQENRMPLPSERTILRYIKKLKPAYGFDNNVFEIMKEKAKHMNDSERRGCLLLDEMAIDESIYFDKELLKFLGFVDLGEHTPEEDKNKRANHALVIMFQPLKGQWVQAVGAFLSAGAVKGPILQKLVLEATALLENNGYYVDCVSTDGAPWNRTMWELFGISKESCSYEHPMDSSRTLRFASDFPHLIKNLWTRVVNKKVLKLPEGEVKLSHWAALVEKEEKLGVTRNFLVKREHLDPTNYQRMNVRMAMRFFSHSVGTAMESYQQEGVPELQDSAPTIAFIKRINAVVDAMNSQRPVEALKPDPNSTHHKVLLDFLKYLEEIEEMSLLNREKEAKEKAAALYKSRIAMQEHKQRQALRQGATYVPRQQKQKEIDTESIHEKYREKPATGANQEASEEFTQSTFLGLWVTIRTALDLLKFLNEKHGFSYLMTRRINQDNLEHFFGHIRGNCGGNSHPDARMFIQVYRLLSTYSLVKPPRGSNVTGGEMLTTLFLLRDLASEQNQHNREELEAKLDVIFEGGLPPMDDDHMRDHDYMQQPIDEKALTVLAGYVSRKMRSIKPCCICEECFKSVCKDETEVSEERESFLMQKSHGGLLTPSKDLYQAVYWMEQAVLKVTATTPPHSRLFFHVLDALMCSVDEGLLGLGLGCPQHSKALMSAVITFYLTVRMHFVCTQSTKVILDKKRKKKNQAKQAKQA